MAEPACEKCGGHNFYCREVGGNEIHVFIYIIYCTDCGWIAGTAGGGI